MRARQPDQQGFVTRDGVRVGWDLYENDGPTILLMPTWPMVHSRHWKAQIPYLARHFRVVVIEGRGNGRSDRPTDPAAYSDHEFIADAIEVLDATGTKRAVVAGVSMGGHWGGLLAGLHPDRITGAILMAPVTSLAAPHPERAVYPWDEELDTDEGWAKYNRHYWRSNYPDFVEFFISQIFSEPHSTKQREDSVGWGLETSGDIITAVQLAPHILGEEERRTLELVRCPVLVIHGTEDRIIPHLAGKTVAEICRGSVLSLEGSGHCPQARDPVVVNRAIHRFVELAERQRARNPVEVAS